MAGNDEVKDLEALALELRNDDDPKPEEKEDYPLPEKKPVSYKNVDVTISFRKEERKDVKGDEKRILFTDKGVELDNSLFDEKRGVLRIPIVLAKEMIYHYDDYDAFRPKEELEALVPFVKGVPVSRGHPPEKIVTDRDEVMGWAVEAEFEEDELRAVLEISDKSLIADIEDGKLRGVSPGHFSRLDKSASGEYEGAHFDVTQRDIFIDHIAIVEEGRCSVADGCGIVIDAEVGDTESKKKKGDEEEIMEPKAVANKVEAAIKVAETIETKAEEEKKVLEEIVDLVEVPKAAIAKVKRVIGIAEKIREEAKEKLVGSLEKVKEAVTGTKEEEKGGYPLPEKKEEGTDAITAEVVKRLEDERDELKASLDEIVSVEKEMLVDELSSLQDVKTEDDLKGMSLDALKSDLELVKALRGSKFTVDDDGDTGDGSGAITKAYKGVGRGGKGE